MEREAGVEKPDPEGSTTSQDGGDATTLYHRAKLPFAVVLATLLHCAEFVLAACMCDVYSKRGQTLRMGLTAAFVAVPAAITQLVLVFVHGDMRKDTPIVVLAHLLLGPVIRCAEALIVYCKARSGEGGAGTAEPYVTLLKKVSLKKGQLGRESEWAVAPSGRALATHSHAFRLTSVVQAFLGSAPQLVLQACSASQDGLWHGGHDALRGGDALRAALMAVAFASAAHGALACSVLDISLRYGGMYEVRFGVAAYPCLALWRGLEVATRLATLVLLATALARWAVAVVLANLLLFFLLPWAVFWAKRRRRQGQGGSKPSGTSPRLRGAAALCLLLTLFYACVNVTCWSALQPDLSRKRLVDRREHWRLQMAYYYGRLAENVLLAALWYSNRPETETDIRAVPLLASLLVGYLLAVLFMLLFYQFCHPCRRVLEHNICVQLLFGCFPLKRQWDDVSSESSSASLEGEPNPAPQNAQHIDVSQLGDQETAIT